MKRFVSLFFIFAFILPFALNAISTFNGQLVYLKQCRICHLSSKIFVTTHTADEWNQILDSDGILLSNSHLNKDEVYVNSKEGIHKGSHAYFKSDEYKHKYGELKAFIIESAKNNEKN
ncbi:MAG: hypothetical protein Q7U00_02490 [Sulfurimonas sp.]|nr:hypothetical protein [Sulfurimonas sp.]